jgi:hypothetical protein
MVRVRVGLVRRQFETRPNCSRENCGQNRRGKTGGQFRPNRHPTLKISDACLTQHGRHRTDVPAEASKRAANMAQALQVSMDLHGGEMHASSRVAILGRYRRYSDLRKDIQSAALENVSESSFLAHAKRIGVSDGKVLFADESELTLVYDLALYAAQSAALENVSESSFLAHAKRIGLSDGRVVFAHDDSEVALVYDLALYTAQPGRTRAIDRCARKRLTAAQPDEALVLQALQASRFSIFRVIGRCEPAGVLLEDLMRGGTIPLLDKGLEQSAKAGDVFAMRVAPIEDFVINCGAVVPMNGGILEATIEFLTGGVAEAERAALADHRRFAAALYELAIELELMSSIIYR